MALLYSEVNGEISQNLNILDRGFSYGDGIFTTAKILNGEVECLDLHLLRLKEGVERIYLKGVDFDAIRQSMIECVKSFELAVLKVVISAGAGGRGYSRVGCETPTIVITVHPFPTQYKQWSIDGIKLGIAQSQLGLSTALSGLKHLNRLEQVLVRKELDESDFDDLLVTNINNEIIEASAANVFWFESGSQSLFTSDLSFSGVNGIARQRVIKSFNDIKIVSKKLDEIDNISAMFLCNSVMGIVPVRKLGERNLNMNIISDVKKQITL